MNIIRMTGGLGNQMFQYALFLALKSQGKDVKLDDITEYEGRDARPIMLWAFDIDYPKASREEINILTDGFLKLSHRVRRKLFGRKTLEYREKGGNFDGQVLVREPAYLTGYFQSEKYFKNVEPEVRKAFCFSNKIWEHLSPELFNDMKNYQSMIEGSLSVAVHVRRGDYLENEEAYGGICTEAYYKKAINVMEEKFPGAKFFVFCNEPQWADEWLKRSYDVMYGGGRFVMVRGTTEDTGYLDMFLMSRCRHHIVANSSFSWWGAWLNGSEEKIVIAPSKWFNNQDVRDIYTREMIKISPKGEWVENCPEGR